MSRSDARTMTMLSSVTRGALLGSIRGYRLIVSPWLPRRCRFEPSCSAYAAEAIDVHGPVRGTGLALARIGRCHPWHAGGHDPVPAPVEKSTVRLTQGRS